MERRFTIIGAGVGSADGLTGEAKRALLETDCAISTARIAENLHDFRPIQSAAFSQLAESAIASGGANVAVLVSGDPGFFSAAQSLRNALTPYGEVETICGQSSLSTFCARLGVSWEDAVLLSLHGRSGGLLGAVSYHRKVFALTGGKQRANDLCRALCEAGLGGVRVSLGENLGAENETIFTGTAAEAAALSCGDLAVLWVENEHAADLNLPLYDCDFTRGAVPMTKQEVRWTAVNLLELRPGDIAWDVGAGTGSVALEMGRRAHRGTVYAIERKSEALELIEQNRRALGGFNVLPVAGFAPEALYELPAPNAAFIGGSTGKLHEILRVLLGKNPKIRVVVSAIALETLEEARRAMAELGFADVQVCQIAAARGKIVGGYTMMTANNPVFLISGGGRGHA